MSLLWGYDARKCEGEYCPNNCDNCYKAEIEADGFITRFEALCTDWRTDGKAKPAEECLYPKCEECDKYHGHYCTVPIVVTKQMYCLFTDRIDELDKRLSALGRVVWNDILGDK